MHLLATATLLAALLSSPAVALPGRKSPGPPAFFLAGDSTTAVQSAGGGGWGNGFLSFLIRPAFGTNYGHDGATTVSFVAGGDWAKVLAAVQNATNTGFEPWVTIQFGHNDQKPASNITLEMYRQNLMKLAGEVKEAGGTPVLVTPLTRRNFVSEHEVDLSLYNQTLATISAARESHTTYIDLNAASIAYVDAIGEEAAHAYNLVPNDNTHLNAWGSVVFGRIVADLLLHKEGKRLDVWIKRNETMSALIAEGIPV